MDKVMVETGRIRTHCHVAGPEDGVPVLLVHGNITTGRFWQDVADGFPGGYRLVAPDLRAFGQLAELAGGGAGRRYQAGGGSVRELVLQGCGHGPPIERSAEVREQLLAHIEGAA